MDLDEGGLFLELKGKSQLTCENDQFHPLLYHPQHFWLLHLDKRRTLNIFFFFTLKIFLFDEQLLYSVSFCRTM